MRSWEGVSVFATYGAARDNAQKWALGPGEYLAELVIPDDLPVTYDGPHRRGHYDLHNVSAGALLACVTRVVLAPTTPPLPQK